MTIHGRPIEKTYDDLWMELEVMRRSLWWLAEELANDADAIGPVPDLAERNLRHHADIARAIREGCSYEPFSSRVCARGTKCCEEGHGSGPTLQESGSTHKSAHGEPDAAE